MVTPEEVFSTYTEFHTLSPAYERLYENLPDEIGGVFASMHEQLNGHFKFMNSKMRAGRHFNAEDSRQLIQLINSINQLRRDLKRADVELVIREDYDQLLETCADFLLLSGGSPIPDGLPPIETERFEPIFSTSAWAPKARSRARQRMEVVGEGSFAIVHKYVDDEYGITVAVKTARPRITERDLQRFRKEFELMKRLDFPYIVRAYSYSPDRDSFTMEYCHETLGDYIKRVNQSLPWSSRKRIALQFLYGLNYLHATGILHRDISLNNVLVQHFDRGAVVVKLSDFGLHKDPESDFTALTTELKGSIIDPALNSFKDFAATNDIYAAGRVLSFVFSGRIALGAATGPEKGVISRATNPDVAARHGSIADMILEVESLDAVTPATASGLLA